MAAGAAAAGAAAAGATAAGATVAAGATAAGEVGMLWTKSRMPPATATRQTFQHPVVRSRLHRAPQVIGATAAVGVAVVHPQVYCE